MASVFDELLKELPPLFFREAIAHLIPGLSPRYVANLDSAGKGPDGRMRIGRKIAYSRAEFVDWLKSRQETVEMISPRKRRGKNDYAGGPA